MSATPHSPANLDRRTVEGFGAEWHRFDQSELKSDECKRLFARYFGVFPWDALPADAVGFDLGCGSGRWAKEVLPRVGHLHLIDPSGALDVARRNLMHDAHRCSFHRGTLDDASLAPASMDFGYSLGVLHHVPDTQAELRKAVSLLKPGAPFVLYLYYALETRRTWYRMLWYVSDFLRRTISRSPNLVRHATADLFAAFVYWPLARMAQLGARLGFDTKGMPLAAYADLSFYTMRTDSLDRFGTPLEWRFTRDEMELLMENAGLHRIRFSDDFPYWTAIGFRQPMP